MVSGFETIHRESEVRSRLASRAHDLRTQFTFPENQYLQDIIWTVKRKKVLNNAALNSTNSRTSGVPFSRQHSMYTYISFTRRQRSSQKARIPKNARRSVASSLIHQRQKRPFLEVAAKTPSQCPLITIVCTFFCPSPMQVELRSGQASALLSLVAVMQYLYRPAIILLTHPSTCPRGVYSIS